MKEQMEHERREQMRQLKDKIEQLKRAQAPALCDAVLVERMIEAVRDTMDEQAAEIARLREVLNKLAAWDDAPANDRLALYGSYSSFDEPGAVKTARAALAATEPRP